MRKAGQYAEGVIAGVITSAEWIDDFENDENIINDAIQLGMKLELLIAKDNAKERQNQ